MAADPNCHYLWAGGWGHESLLVLKKKEIYKKNYEIQCKIIKINILFIFTLFRCLLYFLQLIYSERFGNRSSSASSRHISQRFFDGLVNGRQLYNVIRLNFFMPLVT